MPKVSGAAPLRRRAATTRASASAVTMGSNGSPSTSRRIAACNAGDTVIALPLRPRLKDATSGTLTWPNPRLDAIAIGAIKCAASNRPMLSLSRTFDHDTSRASVTSKPSALVNPLSTATSSAAASISGMKPICSAVFISTVRTRSGSTARSRRSSFFPASPWIAAARRPGLP
jgi:hypothetical protein